MTNLILWMLYPVAKLFVFSVIAVIALGRLLFEIALEIEK
jgi:hypothetical protein